MSEKGIRFIDEYRNKALTSKLIERIKKTAAGSYTFMEVCGGHTSAIHRFGIPSMLPAGIKLISGPGCPVCVTGTGFIDKAVAYSRMDGFIVATFGDLLRVPGSESSLENEKARGADVRVVFSGLEALETAALNPDKKVVFLGIGFETTTPGTAVTISEAKRRDLYNFYLLSSHKVMPPAMETIIKDGVRLDGFICPGHVATISGADDYNFIPEKFGLACVIAGFEPVDLLQSVYMLLEQVNTQNPSVEIQYRRAVTKYGNQIALGQIRRVFEKCDSDWRGFGTIPGSGLKLRSEYESFDAEKAFPVDVIDVAENKKCLCPQILRGYKSPVDCELFANSCIPENPIGACMVSEEGACNTYYRYERR
jgi:hydrogenase expression/formation protein HypD